MALGIPTAIMDAPGGKIGASRPDKGFINVLFDLQSRQIKLQLNKLIR